jgi:hypothetical protein
MPTSIRLATAVKLKLLLFMTASGLVLLAVHAPSFAAPGRAHLLPVQAPLSPPRDSANILPPSPLLSPPAAPPSQSPLTPAPSMPSPPSPQLRSPAVVTGCNAGGCLDSSGNWYPGAGGLYLNRNGAACARTGMWMQCN